MTGRPVTQGTTTSGTHRVPDVVLFAVGDASVDAREVVERLPPADLAKLVDEVARGQAARRLGEVDDDVRREAEKAFRADRHLVAADEMERWLGTWQLGVAAWRAQLRRQAALAMHGDRAVATPADRDEVDDEMVWAALVCDGTLRDHARGLARRMAAAAALGDDPTAAEERHVAAWLDGAVDGPRVERELTENALDWLRVRWTLLHADDAEAAREARLCIDDDAVPIARVATMLGHPARPGEGWLHAAPGELREVLLRTDVGRTSAPIAGGVGFELLHLAARERPDATDDRIRTAVRARLADQALDLEVRDRVLWHVDF